MDTFHDCQQCHGPYRWLPISSWPDSDRANPRLVAIEVCRDCGHYRRIHQPSDQT